MSRFLAFAALTIGGYFAFSAYSTASDVAEQEQDDFGLEVVDSPENVKVYGDDFRSGADVDFDLSAYFEDLFNRVSAYTQEEINYFADVWSAF